LFVVDSDRNLKGIVNVDDMAKLQKKGETSVDSVLEENVYITTPETSIADLLPIALKANYPVAVVNDDKRLMGVVDRATIIAEVGGELEDITPTDLSSE